MNSKDKYKYEYISNREEGFYIKKDFHDKNYKSVYIKKDFYDNKNLIYYYLKENDYY